MTEKTKDKIGEKLFLCFVVGCLLFPIYYIWPPFGVLLIVLYVAVMAYVFIHAAKGPSGPSGPSGPIDPPGGWAAGGDGGASE